MDRVFSPGDEASRYQALGRGECEQAEKISADSFTLSRCRSLPLEALGWRRPLLSLQRSAHSQLGEPLGSVSCC